uniref:Putative granulin n=2 Tax=Ixodes ricinus TaxID=34613 RepID=V5HDN4_IXORI
MKTSGTMIVLALAVAFTEGADVTFVRCPNGALCPDRTTCCLQNSGQYGCCPYQFAVCCSDHLHCCPEGYHCNMSNGTCLQISTTTKKAETLLTPMVLSPQLGPDAPAVESVRCPDGNFCQDGQTCCLLSGGRYGCCPYPHAVCCSDHASCCPEGYRCKVSTHSCVAGNSTLPMLKKLDTIGGSPLKEPAPVERVRCPDGNYCQDGQTCCLTTGGRFGCCPYPHAECCSDHASCCPEGYRCQLSTHSCILGNSTVAMLKKVSTFSDSPVPGNTVLCPDGSSCLDQQTCCQSKNGSYGCCPAPEAVCCEDHETCCPKGTVCLEAIQACIGLSEMSPMLKKVPAFRTEKKPRLVSDVQCPDGGSCPDGQTCCQIQGGSYGCCPYEDATCCSDDVHCCPSGYECDTATASCRKGDIFAAALRKLPARRPLSPVVNDATPTNQKCPDGAQCDDDQTCCELSDHSYGCCPYNHAVCCPDLVHCCPEGYMCDTAEMACVQSRNRSSIPLIRLPLRSSLNSVEVKGKLAPPLHADDSPFSFLHNASPFSSIPLATLKDDASDSPSAGSILCPNKIQHCPDGTQCCLSYDTIHYFCCPYQNGTCCEDGLFCCKAGFRCFVETQSCIPLD